MIAGTARLINTSTGRIHVCWFTPRPFPGGPANNRDVARWQSRSHHSDGAATDEEADAHMRKLRDVLKRNLGYTMFVDLGACEWDGEGIPAMILLGPATPPKGAFAVV